MKPKDIEGDLRFSVLDAALFWASNAYLVSLLEGKSTVLTSEVPNAVVRLRLGDALQ